MARSCYCLAWVWRSPLSISPQQFLTHAISTPLPPLTLRRLRAAAPMSAPAAAAVPDVISAPIEVRPGVQSVTVSGTKFEVATRYRIIKPVGHGAYGVVVYVPPPRHPPCSHASIASITNV